MMKKREVARICSVLMAAALAVSAAGCQSKADAVNETVTTAEQKTAETEKQEETTEQVTVLDDLDYGIFHRNTSRNYAATEVSEDQIEKIIQAVFAAPTADGARGTEIFVVTDRDKMQLMKNGNPFSDQLDSAPLAFVIAINHDIAKHEDLLALDAGIAAEAVMVEAASLGLDSVPMSIWPQKTRMESTVEALNMPENIQPYIMVCVGYPENDAVSSASIDYYNEDRVHRNTYEAAAEITEASETEAVATELEGIVYTSSAEGIESTVTVKIIVDDDTIKSCEIDASGETEDIGGKAAEQIAAEVVKNQSFEIDAVAGATITSEAIQTALEDISKQSDQ